MFERVQVSSISAPMPKSIEPAQRQTRKEFIEKWLLSWSTEIEGDNEQRSKQEKQPINQMNVA